MLLPMMFACFCVLVSAREWKSDHEVNMQDSEQVLDGIDPK